MPELGTAYVQIIPTADGIEGSISNLIGAEAEKAGNDSGDKAGNSFVSKMVSAIQGADIGSYISKAIGAVGDLAAYGDNIDKMSQKLGISAQAYQEWDAVLQHSGSSIDAMKPAFKTLIGQVEAGSDAFQELGLSQEQLAGMSQEEIFSATITALQNMEEGSKRSSLAQKLLGRGAQELGPLLNTSAEDTEAMKHAVHDLGGVMSDEAVKDAAAYQDALQDMNTAIQGLSRGLLSEFLPSLTGIMNGVSMIFSGDPAGGVGMILTGIGSVVTTLFTSIPQMVEGVGQMVLGVITAIQEQLPAFIEQGTAWVTNMVTGMIEGIPKLITGAGELLTNLVAYLMENLPTWLEQGIQMVSSMASGLIGNIPEIVSSLLQVIGNLISTIMDKMPEFLDKGFELIGNVAAGLIKAIPDIVRATPKVLGEIINWINEQDWLGMGMDLITKIADGIGKVGEKIWNAMSDAGEEAIRQFKEIDWADLGHNIIDGIVSGISNWAHNLWESVKGLARDAISKAKGEIDAHSPSRKFASEVGRWIPAGIAMGIDENTDVLLDSVDRMSQMATVEAAKFAYHSTQTYTANSSDRLIARADAMLALMTEYYPEMAKNGIDGQRLYDSMNRALGMAVI